MLITAHDEGQTDDAGAPALLPAVAMRVQTGTGQYMQYVFVAGHPGHTV